MYIKEKERRLQTAYKDESKSSFSNSGSGCLEADGTIYIKTKQQGEMD